MIHLSAHATNMGNQLKDMSPQTPKPAPIAPMATPFTAIG